MLQTILIGRIKNGWIDSVCEYLRYTRCKNNNIIHCYRCRRDKRSSTCSLPDEEGVHVNYGDMIHVRVLQQRLVLANGSILLGGYTEVGCRQYFSTPVEKNIFRYVLFWGEFDRIRTSLYFH